MKVSTVLAHDPSAVSFNQVEFFSGNLNPEQLENVKDKLTNLQSSMEERMKKKSEEISAYQEKLETNNQLLSEYDKNTKNKMSVIATRDRMLQLSQERNVYKKKMIYVLLSIIIALLVAVISAYTIFGK
jgi:predicted  nucleic acid-binding Zn-ribbon protein